MSARAGGLVRKRRPTVRDGAPARTRRGRRFLFAAFCALCWLASPAQASDETRANRLFVEAAKLVQAAEKEADAVRKLELLKHARRNLEAIVDRHPSSGLAVKLVSGQNVGTVSLAGARGGDRGGGRGGGHSRLPAGSDSRLRALHGRRDREGDRGCFFPRLGVRRHRRGAGRGRRRGRSEGNHRRCPRDREGDRGCLFPRLGVRQDRRSAGRGRTCRGRKTPHDGGRRSCGAGQGRTRRGRKGERRCRCPRLGIRQDRRSAGRGR